VCLSLCIPAVNWWERLELCLEFLRESCILCGIALSSCVPGLPACMLRRPNASQSPDIHKNAGVAGLAHQASRTDETEPPVLVFQPIPTLCGYSHADRTDLATCCVPEIHSFPQYQDSCLPTGGDCIERCCSDACPPRCCLSCCPRPTNTLESRMFSHGVTPHTTPPVPHAHIHSLQPQTSRTPLFTADRSPASRQNLMTRCVCGEGGGG
jgi:hypothetical protein